VGFDIKALTKRRDWSALATLPRSDHASEPPLVAAAGAWFLLSCGGLPARPDRPACQRRRHQV